MRRLVIAAAVGAAVAGTAVPSLATTAPTQSVPVYIWTTPDGSVCFQVSQQVPHCVSTKPVTDVLPADYQIGPVTLHLSTAGGVVSVGAGVGSQPLVGAWVGNGEVCVGVSEQVPVCVPLD